MLKTFRQSVVFPGVKAEELFAVYLDASRHSAAIGADAQVTAKAGARFRLVGDGGALATLACVFSKHRAQACSAH